MDTWTGYRFTADWLETPNRIRWTRRELQGRAFQHAENRWELSGAWSGWRTHGRYLIAPDGSKLTPEAVWSMIMRTRAARAGISATTRAAQTHAIVDTGADLGRVYATPGAGPVEVSHAPRTRSRRSRGMGSCP